MTLATKTTRRARITCTCPTCVTMGHEAPANGVFMCRGGEQIEFLGYHEGILIVVSDQKSAAQADLDEHRHEIARRALADATLSPDQAETIEALAEERDLDAEVEAAAMDSDGTLFPVETPDPRNSPEYRRYTETRREEFIPMSPAEAAAADPMVGGACGAVVVDDLDAAIERAKAAMLAEHGALEIRERIWSGYTFRWAIRSWLDYLADDAREAYEARELKRYEASMTADDFAPPAELPFTPDNSPIPFDGAAYDREMAAAATALLVQEEARGFCPEARAELVAVEPAFATDHIGPMVAEAQALFDRVFADAPTGRAEEFPLRDAWLDAGEAALYLQSAAHHLRAANEPERADVAAALHAIEAVIKTMTTAFDPIRNDIGNEVRAWEQQQADKAA